jgi:hypothetical protein
VARGGKGRRCGEEAIGQVYGGTTPSNTKVEVIEENDQDYAINVFLRS